MKGTRLQRANVVVLYNVSERLVRGEARDLIAEQGVIACAHEIAQALEAAGYRVMLLPLHHDVELALADYAPSEWVVFNLAEGLEGRMFEEARIAWALEAMGYTATGAQGNALALTTHKTRCKALLAKHGIPTPTWWSFPPGDQVGKKTAAEMHFPVIVKPVAEDASFGLDYNAVVNSLEELRRRVAYIWKCYRQTALVETFIDGREFNVAVWGMPPEVLPLAEIDFSAFESPAQRIVSYSAKWEADTFEYHHTPVTCPARVDAKVEARVRQMALDTWQLIGYAGYGRVDMRVSGDDIPYVIDVNCNPDISSDAGFYRAAKAAGYSYVDMVEHILGAALRAQVV